MKETDPPAESESLRKATLLLNLAAQGEADLQAGRALPQEEALARVRTRLRGTPGTVGVSPAH
ncbi:MAG TPA: hypothetical protein VLQ45_05785 [Thermoanaerobaculia bacterium]|nr:hypothetical protein [Thermoanaerobaculia bacterium]